MCKEFAAICEGKDSEDVFYESLLFLSSNYAIEFGGEAEGALDPDGACATIGGQL
jgi:hypothetical protein